LPGKTLNSFITSRDHYHVIFRLAHDAAAFALVPHTGCLTSRERYNTFSSAIRAYQTRHYPVRTCIILDPPVAAPPLVTLQQTVTVGYSQPVGYFLSLSLSLSLSLPLSISVEWTDAFIGRRLSLSLSLPLFSAHQGDDAACCSSRSHLTKLTRLPLSPCLSLSLSLFFPSSSIFNAHKKESELLLHDSRRISISSANRSSIDCCCHPHE
jgi:hypothetical protein